MNREEIIGICKKYSMLSVERLNCNLDSIEYVEYNKIPGDIVEIGVWKGGSMLAMMMAWEQTKLCPRNFHLYDTFEGMTAATIYDKDHNSKDATELMKKNENIKCISSLEEVKQNIQQHTSLIPQYHVGDILKNTYIPEKIAVLRLDTDWYESTKHELETFYQNVVPGGYVIIDDYGHWMGCKKAVDEFLITHPNITLYNIDYTGRYFIKPT